MLEGNGRKGCALLLAALDREELLWVADACCAYDGRGVVEKEVI